jgi:hypothetical protein
MDKYRLDLKSEDDFEKIIVQICQNVLGIGVTGFAKGKDGGRDGRFEGTAQNYPSTSKSWDGKFIIQAKHTTNSEASCSDNDFFGNKTSVVALEIEKIKKLKAVGEIDNYFCFTNRKLTGGSEEKIRNAIKNESKIANVGIHGIEDIERYLTKEIIKEFGLNRNCLPFEFYEKEIQEIIVLFGEESKKLSSKESLIEDDFYRPPIEIKNRLNKLGENYFRNVIQDEMLKYDKQIRAFLKDPRNIQYTVLYERTVFELKRKIEISRDNFDKFEHAFEYIYLYIFDENNEKIIEHRNLIYVFLHFMYYNCDIGRNR